MPFDGSITAQPVTPDYKQLAELSDLVRHKERWPVGFTWCFADGNTCAVGLYNMKHARLNAGVMRSIQLTQDQFYRLFCRPVATKHTNGMMYAVTPEMVADEIDLFIKENASEPVCA